MATYQRRDRGVGSQIFGTKTAMARLARRTRRFGRITRESEMKENVGGAELVVRSIAGPTLLVAGYRLLDGRRGRPRGLFMMMWGAVVIETALTRTCSINGLLGRDTAT